MLSRTVSSFAPTSVTDVLTEPIPRPTSSAAPEPGSRRTYDCSACGHMLRVVGSGRHQVYFEPGDERLDNPVMNRVCPACGHDLPGKNSSGRSPALA